MFSELTFHGGDIDWAADKFNIPRPDWIDLSTGINPNAYPFSPLNDQVFKQLPYLTNAFLDSIKNYYGQPMTPVAGSQEAIDLLPRLLTRAPILLPDIGYKAYEKAFIQHDYEISHYPAIHHQPAIAFLKQSLKTNSNQHLLIINPNNPSGLTLSVSEIHDLLSQMNEDAYLIIDEAFIDMTPHASLLNTALPRNCILLRSFGKFFGLAGLRLGFIATNVQLTRKLQEMLNPWRINGCAQAIAQEALNNTSWQTSNRQWIANNAQIQARYLAPLMASLGAETLPSQNLFHSFLLPIKIADKLFLDFAKKGILLRPVDVNHDFKILRFGVVNMNNAVQLQRFLSVISAQSYFFFFQVNSLPI